VDEEGVQGLARRAVDLWLNLELSRLNSEENYSKIEKVLKRRFGADDLNPLLLSLGLLEMALIDDALKNKQYFSQEEREALINHILENLAQVFPQVVDEMEKILCKVAERIEEFKRFSRMLKKSG